MPTIAHSFSPITFVFLERSLDRLLFLPIEETQTSPLYSSLLASSTSLPT
jgi:hypothetical protein